MSTDELLFTTTITEFPNPDGVTPSGVDRVKNSGADWSVTTPLLVAPFDLEILSADYLRELGSWTGTGANAMVVKLARRPAASGSTAYTMALKSTDGDLAGPAPMNNRETWSFDSASWFLSNTKLVKGEQLVLEHILKGTAYVRLPISITVRYRPL